jgi:hypothetical protein
LRSAFSIWTSSPWTVGRSSSRVTRASRAASTGDSVARTRSSTSSTATSGEPQLGVGAVGVLEQPVDELLAPPAGRHDRLEHLATVVVQALALPQLHELGEAAHGPQGLAQVVCRGVGECGERLVRATQRDGGDLPRHGVADASRQGVGIEAPLDEVVLRPAADRLERGLLAPVDGHDDDRCVRCGGVDRRERVEALDVGQPEVEQDGVEARPAGEQLARGAEAVDDRAPEARHRTLGQEPGDLPRVGGVVLDDEDRELVGGRRSVHGLLVPSGSCAVRSQKSSKAVTTER